MGIHSTDDTWRNDSNEFLFYFVPTCSSVAHQWESSLHQKIHPTRIWNKRYPKREWINHYALKLYRVTYVCLTLQLILNVNIVILKLQASYTYLVRWIHHDITYWINCSHWFLQITSLHENSNCLKTCYMDSNHNIPQKLQSSGRKC